MTDKKSIFDILQQQMSFNDIFLQQSFRQ